MYNWDGIYCTNDARSWINVPKKGVRRLQQYELMKLKGIQDSKYSLIPYAVLAVSAEQHTRGYYRGRYYAIPCTT